VSQSRYFDLSTGGQPIEYCVTTHQMEAMADLNSYLCWLCSRSEVVLTNLGNHSVVGTRETLLDLFGTNSPYQDNESKRHEANEYSDTTPQCV